MSDPSASPDVVFMRPWQKVALWVAIILAGVGMLWLFSSRSSSSTKVETKPQPTQVQTDPNIPALVRPTFYPTTPSSTGNGRGGGGGKSQKTQAEIEDEEENRKALAAPISGFVRSPRGTESGNPNGQDRDGRPSVDARDPLEASLKPSVMEGTKAIELPNPRWTIGQGRVLACKQVTRINTTLPGGVDAIIGEDIKGDTADVTLLDKGSTIFGTIQHALMNGADRVGVLWQGIKTPILYDTRGMPHRFTVTANSPAANQMGETGLDADINRHLGIKIGGILGFSFAQGAIQAAIQKAGQNQGGQSTSINLNSIQSGSDQAVGALLNSWVTIPDVGTRDQGLPCSVFLMRDLDLHDVFKLRLKYRGY
jgi:type IV secretion system protein VirB10